MYVRDTFEVGYDDSVDVTIVDENGGEVYMADFSAYGYTEPQESDIVYINDEMFKITGTEEEGLHICRYSDEEVNYDAFTTVYADTQVYTKASYERKNDILILEIGSNGGGEVQNASNRGVFGVRKSRYDTGRRKMTANS